MNHRWLLLLSVSLFAAFGLEAQKLSAPSPARFQFREPHLRGYVIESPRPSGQRAQVASANEWLRGHAENNPGSTVEFGNRILVRLRLGKNVNSSLIGDSLQLARTINENTFIFQAADALTALQEANRLSQSPDVLICVPVMRHELGRHSVNAYEPNDPFFPDQWNLSHRDTNGVPLGADMNILTAWEHTRGAGVVIGVADDGVELTHPELAQRASGMPHYNFHHGTTNGMPVTEVKFEHGTAVAGMAVAEGNNGIGMVGTAPEAKLASWVIFTTNAIGNEAGPSDEQLMDMFQYGNDSVAVQNHSWGKKEEIPSQEGITPMAEIGIESAIQNGRGGRGVVMVRSVGNFRNWTDPIQPGKTILANANDDGYPSDRRVIGVAGVNPSGRVTRYSNPGACVLIAAAATESLAAPDTYIADPTQPSLFMVDRQGTRGYNRTSDASGDYCFSNNAVIGTSFAAPQIAGLAAMMLSVNTNLTYRDVQQILVLASRHIDFADPDVATNGAGFVVSHNVGFGVPDAGRAVAMARIWTSRPPLTSVSFTNESSVSIEDDGLRVVLSNAPPELEIISASPTMGVHPDDPTEMLPVVDIGLATNALTTNLTGKAALIQRGSTNFAAKIQFAADAGAAFAIIYNSNVGTPTERLTNTYWRTTLPMTGTDFSPIPAVFINREKGNALRNFVSTNTAHVQLKLLSTNYTFSVPNALLCEHIAVDVNGDNTDATGSTNSRRGDIRITLTSPTGTRSVLQRLGTDTNKLTSPAWTYHTTHDFFENSAGVWTVAVSDEAPGATATIQSVVLRIYGTPIGDSDFDGLDDAWENTYFGNLDQTAQSDPDADGFSNMHEQVMGTNPDAECNFTISQSQLDVPNSTNVQQISLVAGTSCEWSVVETNDWIKIISGSSGIGNGTVIFEVAANTSAANRSATMIIAGKTLRVNQIGNYTPASVPGKTFTFFINGGSGGYATTGSFMFVASPLGTYQIIPRTNTIAGRTGTYSSTPNNTFTKMIQTDQETIHLNFTYASRGDYVFTNLSGGQHGTFVVLPSAPDFNFDGLGDLLFQRTNGPLASWFMNGTALLGSASLRQPAAGWRVTGVADFNTDGSADIFFQHDNRKLAVWLMNGTNFSSAQLMRGGTPAAVGWKNMSAHDFNNDGKTDLLFQHDDRRLAIWLMNGTNLTSGVVLRGGTPIAAGWKAVAVGDFNGDLRGDILFQHDSRKLAYWYMDGTAFLGSDLVRDGFIAGAGWTARGVADVNGDGLNDILFQNTNTRVLAVWYMNGKNLLGSALLRGGTPIAGGWELFAPK